VDFLKNSKYPKADLTQMNSKTINSLIERDKKTPLETFLIPSSEKAAHPPKIMEMIKKLLKSIKRLWKKVKRKKKTSNQRNLYENQIHLLPSNS
jgi:hypothetical protein